MTSSSPRWYCWPFLLVFCSVSWSAPAPTTTGIDRPALLEALRQLEGGSGLGGPWCITRATWNDHVSAPYLLSIFTEISRSVANQILDRTEEKLRRQGQTPTVLLLACRWRHGPAGMKKHTTTPCVYALKADALYHDLCRKGF